MMKYRFEDLRVGEEILDFIDLVYETTQSFPSDEKFALTSQIRRAATSVYLNIAEGSARKSGPDFARFITMSLGSLVEVSASDKIALRQQYLTNQRYQEVRNKSQGIWFQLCALRDSQKKS
ncbi:four helix bundle protein [Patescibacteria group bacterium]